MYESLVPEMKAAFGQALVATFGEILFVFLQTLQNSAITRLYCKTEPFHVFDTGKLISFSFLPPYHPLPDDLLTSSTQLFHALYDATSAGFSRKRIRTV